MILDTAAIHERRLLHGISGRELSQQIGFSITAMTALERGDNHHSLTLAQLTRLADALCVHPTSLFAEPAVPRAESDDVMLEALLLTLAAAQPVRHVADALGWRANRVEAAGAALSDRLKSTGAELIRSSRGFRLKAREDVLEGRATIARRHDSGRSHLRQLEALQLRLALPTGVLPQRTALSNPMRVASGRLLRLGYFESVQGSLHLTTAVKATFALHAELASPGAPEGSAAARSTPRRTKRAKP